MKYDRQLDVVSRVTDILVDQLGVKSTECTPKAAIIKDLGADTLDIFELIAILEAEFECEMPDTLVDNTNTTVGDIIAYIEEY